MLSALYLADLIGVFVFAVSGAIAGRQKEMDLFGMFMLATVTCIGGGTLRSVLTGSTPPPVMTDPAYLIVSACATITSFFCQPLWAKWQRVVSLFDAIGLGIFVCIGVQVSQTIGLSWWACVGMGMVTATFGGVIRDLLRAEIPLIFRKEIYATAALVGGMIYLILDHAQMPTTFNIITTTFLTATIRIIAIKLNLNLPSPTSKNDL